LAGNSAVAQVSVTVQNLQSIVDAYPPSITITAPADGAVVNRTVAVTVSAGDDIGVVKVELYVDGTRYSTSTLAPFTIKWNPRKATTGAHILRCAAYDAAGNVGYSQTVTVYK
jgi:hypothetical protein